MSYPPEGDSRTRHEGPVGKGDRVVRQGECIASIAYEHGHFWETLWKEPANAEVKRVRRDPNVLLPGDRVFIPALRSKQVSGSTDERHRFLRKGVPEMLRIVLLDHEGNPRRDVTYMLEVDGRLYRGRTDGEGRLEQAVSPNARRGKLIVGEGEEQIAYTLNLGSIDPISEVSGVQARLNNLGIECGTVDGQMGPRTLEAIGRFQAKYGLPRTGDLDEPTRRRLEEVHGF